MHIRVHGVRSMLLTPGHFTLSSLALFGKQLMGLTAKAKVRANSVIFRRCD
jgi:hypothetical protein